MLAASSNFNIRRGGNSFNDPSLLTPVAVPINYDADGSNHLSSTNLALIATFLLG